MSEMTDGEQAKATDGTAAAIAAHVAEAVAAYEADRDGLLARIVQLRTNRLDEASRRQMEGLTLKSTYNRDRVRVLAALVTKLRHELQPLLIAVVTTYTLLELAELDLDEYERAEQRNAEDRRVKAEAGFYVEPAAFAEKMFRDFGIDRGGYAALNDDDLKAIAEIIKVRVRQVNSR